MEHLILVPGDNSDADTDLGYGENFHNWLSDYDNESLYIPIVSTLSEESAIPRMADEDAVDHIPKNPPPWGRSPSCPHGAAALIQSGVRHTCDGEWIVCTLPFLLVGGGGWTS